MLHDPIVEEVRKYRDAYAKRFNYDLRAISRDLQTQQKKSNQVLYQLVNWNLSGRRVAHVTNSPYTLFTKATSDLELAGNFRITCYVATMERQETR